MWLFFLDLSIIFCLLPVSYIQVAADYIRSFLINVCGLTDLEDDGWIIGMKFIICLLIMFPLTMFKTIKILNYVSSLSIVFVIVSVIFVIVKFGIWESTGELNGADHPKPEVAVWPYSAS